MEKIHFKQFVSQRGVGLIFVFSFKTLISKSMSPLRFSQPKLPPVNKRFGDQSSVPFSLMFKFYENRDPIGVSDALIFSF